ncbi:MAG: fluoride efflux transporter CrcB [Chitinophagales bacterium]
MLQYLAIFLGGGFGSLCRFALSKWNGYPTTLLPIGTIAANFLSCIILGFVAALLIQKGNDLHETFKPFFAIGFCGGFSTFSTFSLETFTLLQNGNTAHALVNVGLSLGICLVALWIGFWLQGKL